MRVVYFFPFDDGDAEALYEQERKHYHRKGIEFISILDSPKTRLDFLSPTDRLYIVAHGNPWCIGQSQTSEQTLSTVGLAKLMVSKHLTKNFVDIRLLCCQSGINASKYTSSFAQRFKEAMVSFGYNNLQVTGYLGGVITLRDWRLENKETSGFYKERKKGINPDKSYCYMIKSRLGLDEFLRYAASDFKKIF